MPATITTVETFPADVAREQIEEEIRLRLKAGAIRSQVDGTRPKWTLKTEWNVFGEQ